MCELHHRTVSSTESLTLHTGFHSVLALIATAGKGGSSAGSVRLWLLNPFACRTATGGSTSMHCCAWRQAALLALAWSWTMLVPAPATATVVEARLQWHNSHMATRAVVGGVEQWLVLDTGSADVLLLADKGRPKEYNVTREWG